MKNSGLFLNIAKWCLFGLLWFVFWCVWHSSKSVKNTCFFSSFWGFVGWLILVYLGLEGLGVFVFLVFVLLLGVAFVSVLFALFFRCWFVFGVGSCSVFVFAFLFFFVFFSFVVIGGFKGLVRWRFGPPHLALNPPYFLFVFLLLFFVFSCFPFFGFNRKPCSS